MVNTSSFGFVEGDRVKVIIATGKNARSIKGRRFKIRHGPTMESIDTGRIVMHENIESSSNGRGGRYNIAVPVYHNGGPVTGVINASFDHLASEGISRVLGNPDDFIPHLGTLAPDARTDRERLDILIAQRFFDGRPLTFDTSDDLVSYLFSINAKPKDTQPANLSSRRRFRSYHGGIFGRGLLDNEADISKYIVQSGISSVPLLSGKHLQDMVRERNESYMWFIDGNSLLTEMFPSRDIEVRSRAFYDMGRIEGELFRCGVRIKPGEDVSRAENFIREYSTGKVYLVDVDREVHSILSGSSIDYLNSQVLEFLADTYQKFKEGIYLGEFRDISFMDVTLLKRYLVGFVEGNIVREPFNGEVDRLVAALEPFYKQFENPAHDRSSAGATIGISDSVYKRAGVKVDEIEETADPTISVPRCRKTAMMIRRYQNSD